METVDEQVKGISEDIESLFENESITSYQISKETGINQTTIAKLRNRERTIDEMKFRNAMALYRLSLTVQKQLKEEK